MEVQEIEGVYHVAGDITECCNLKKFSLPKKQKIIFDFSKVRIINSFGAREWLRELAHLKITPIYRNCSQTAVMQFNLISELSSNGAIIESVRVPAYCPACQKKDTFIVSAQEAEDFEVPKCDKKTCEMDSDVDLETYFQFFKQKKDQKN